MGKKKFKFYSTPNYFLSKKKLSYFGILGSDIKKYIVSHVIEIIKYLIPFATYCFS